MVRTPWPPAGWRAPAQSRVAQLFEAGAALAPVVAAALHGHGQFVRPAESRDEQGDEDGHQRVHPLLEGARIQHGAPGFLGVHDLLGLLNEGGDEPQGNGHHHGQFMHREVELGQGPQQLLDGVGEADGAGGVGEQAGARNEGHHPHRHQHRIAHPFRVDPQKSQLQQGLAGAGDEKEIQQGGEQHDGQDGLEALENQLEGDLAQAVQHPQHQDVQHQSQRVGGHEQDDDIGHGEQQFQAGVQPVDHRIAGKMLPDGDVPQHHLTSFLAASAS